MFDPGNKPMTATIKQNGKLRMILNTKSEYHVQGISAFSGKWVSIRNSKDLAEAEHYYDIFNR